LGGRAPHMGAPGGGEHYTCKSKYKSRNCN